MHSDEIYFDGSRFISASDAADVCGLHRDYIARLARIGKISARRVGKNWYVELLSLENYLQEQNNAKEIRKQELAKQRKEEYGTVPLPLPVEEVRVADVSTIEAVEREIVSAPEVEIVAKTSIQPEPVIETVSIPEPVAEVAPETDVVEEIIPEPVVEIEKAESEQLVPSPIQVFPKIVEIDPRCKQVFTAAFNHRAKVGKVLQTAPLYAVSPAMDFVHKASALVTALVLVFGSYAYAKPEVAAPILAEGKAVLMRAGMAMLRAPETVATLNPADAAFAAAAFGGDSLESVAKKFNKTVDAILFGSNFGFIASNRGTVNVSVGTVQKAKPAVVATPRTNNTQTIVERIQTERVISVTGVTKAYVDQSLASLRSDIYARLFSMENANSTSFISISNSGGGGGGGGSNVDLSNVTITGGSITGVTITGGSVTATAFSGALPVVNGGTATSTAPTYGQLLVGDGAGGYMLVATSSLNIIGAASSPGGANTAVQFNNSGTFGGESEFAYNSTTNLLSFAYGSTTALSLSTLCISSDCRSAWPTGGDGDFSTTSAAYFASLGLSFSTTSANYWESQQTARNSDDLTNNSIEDLNDVAAMTENYGDLFAWNGSTWTDFATSSLAIALSDTTGTLGASRGGTGISSITAAGILIGNYAGTGWMQLSTSTLGLLTTNVAEGSNLYYTNTRVQTYLDTIAKEYFFSTSSAQYFAHSSTTIPKTYTANTFTGAQTFNGGVTVGSLNGPLQANNGVVSATTSIGVLYGGTGLTVAPTYGQVLVGNASGGYTLMSTSSLGISGGSGSSFAYPFPGDATSTLLSFNGGASTTILSANTLCIASDCRTAWPTGGDGFSTSSALYFSSLGLAFSTTSANYFASQGLGFSTSSASYFSSLGLAFSTTSAQYFVHSSTTIPKLYSNNVWTGTNSFGAATSSSFAITNLSNSLLYANSAGSIMSIATSSLGLPTFADLSQYALATSVFAYPFPNNATTSLIAFNGGLTTTNATSTTFAITGTPNALLATRADGSVYATTTIGSNLINTSGNWTGTFDGQEGSYYLANSFSTTSADFWETQQIARTADDLTNNSIEDLNDVAAMTKNYGDLFAWNGSTWTNFATSTLGIALSDTTGTLAVGRGGTGITSTPTYGQILVGNGTGYTLTATSSLGLASLGSFSATSPLSYNSGTGVFSIQQANGSQNGYLTSVDWTTFNNKVSSSSLDSYFTNNRDWQIVAGALVPTTTRGLIVSASSTFSGGLSISNSTTTNATTTNLAVTGAANGLLATRADGSVYATTSLSSLLINTTGDWTGTFDGQEGSYYLANAFSTSSALYFSSLGLAFSTTSANYFASLGLGFSTTSANYWETQQIARTADDLTNNSIEDLNDVAAMTESYGDLFAWNGSTWTDFATSTLAINTNDLIEGSNQFFTAERVDDRVNALLQAGTGINLNYDDTANTLTISATGGGGGGSDVNWTYFNGSGIRPSTTTNQVLVGGSSTSTLANPFAKLGVIGGASIDFATTTRVFADIFAGNTASFGGTATSTFSSTGFLTLPSGFLSQASSTIGSGAQAGGLTISGGATTTGSAYIAGLLTIPGSSGISITDDVAAGAQLLRIGDDAYLTDTDNGNTLGLYGRSDATVGYLQLGSSGGLLTGYNGRIGIGEYTPGSTLAVSGNATIGSGYDTTAAPTNGLLVEGTVGIGTTTPGSLLSLGNTNGINFSTATSSFSSTGGINLAAGCFAINGTCLPTIAGVNALIASSGFAYPFPNNATTSLIAFNGGLTTTNATSSTLAITGTPNALLATRADGSVYATTSINASLVNTTGDWTGTFDGQEGSYYLANSFSTTSANYFASQGLGFSTSSASYFSSLGLAFSTTSAINFVNASTTIPKTYTANTFTGAQTFNGGLTVGSLNGPLQANNGVVSATTSIGVLYGGTGLTTAPSYGNILVGNASGGYTLTSTSSLGLITNAIQSIGAANQLQTGATQTLATSTLAFNGLTAGMTIVSSGNTHTFTPTLTGTLNNSGLTNSTISGIALGGNLADLTATNGTLTFSGAYNGSAARTVGLNLGNANTWTALQIFANASSTYFSTVYASSTSAFFGNLSVGNLNGLLKATNGVVSVATPGTDYANFSYPFPNNATTSTLTITGVSTTNITVGNLASTSQLVVSNGFTFSNVTGVLKAAAGVVTAGLVNLASEVSGILATTNGGTGWGTIQSGTVLLGNGTGALATTTAGTNGQVLALVGGTPSWVATTTLATITGTLSVDKGGTGATTFTNNRLLTGNGTSAIVDEANLTFDGSTLAVTGSATVTGDLQLTNSGSTIFNSDATERLNFGMVTSAVGSVNGGYFTVFGNNYTTASQRGGAEFVFDTRNSGTGGFGVFGHDGSTWTNYFKIAVTGNVGIGTTSPYRTLSVQGNTGISGNLGVAGLTATGTVAFTGIGSGFVGSNSGTLYTFATSTLGFLTSYDAFTHPVAGVSATSSEIWLTGGLLSTGSTTFSGNATTTGMFGAGSLFVNNDRIIDFTGAGLTLVSNALTVNDVTAAMLNAEDFGSFTCNGTTCTVDNDAIALGTQTTGNYVATLASSGSITVGNGSTEGGAATVNLNMGNANTWTALQTFANASSTLFSSVYASSTNAYFGSLSLGALNGPLQANNGVVSATTSIGVLYGGTGLTTAPSYGNILVGNGSGGYTLTSTSTLGLPTFAYLFPNNATSTLLNFNGGLTAYASSTIGNGTATGGLTISGNATTTGNAYFAGNVAIGTTSISSILTLGNAANGHTHASLDRLDGNDGGFLFSTNSSLTGGAGWIAGLAETSVSGLGNNFVIGNYRSGAWQPDFVVGTSGTVGIGTTSPYAKLSVVGDVAAARFIATTSIASIFPFASTTAITSTTASTTNQIISSVLGSLLKTSSTGMVTAAVAGTDYVAGRAAFDFSSNFATTTAATSTSIWTMGVYFASSTVAASQFPYASSTAFTTRELFATNATTTSLAISNISSGSLLKTTTGGAVIAAVAGTDYSNFAYLFPNNATTSGLLLLASTTIGAGGQTNGLTISGGATTTGSAYIAGNLGIGTAAPGSKLEVVGSGAADVIAINNSGSSQDSGVGIKDQGTYKGFFYWDDSEGTMDVNTLSGTGLSFEVNGNEADAMTISATGAVGIGTTSPYRRLSVLGDSAITGTLETANLTATGTVAFTGIGSGFVGSNGGTLYTFATSTLGFLSSYDAFTHPAAGQSATTSLMLFNGGASSTLLSANQLFIGGTATATISSAGVLTLPTALAVTSGGTGAVSFTAGNLLYGSGTGALQSVATSSLAVGGSLTSSGTLGYQIGGTNTTLSLNMGNANSWTALQTFANASTTLISSSYASSTSGFFGSLSVGTLTGILKATNGVISAATPGTDFANFAYLFPNNATTTGLGIYASSTIGSGTQTGGLTISGGATTTGNLFVQGSATTTALAITGTANSLLKTNSSGSIVPALAGTDYANFGYLFPSNATTSLLNLNGGASTTLLTVSGTASTSKFFADGLTNCTSNNVLNWSNGTFGCEADDTGAGGGTFPFTPTTNYGAATNATTSPVWFQNGFQASSTAHLAYASTTALTVSGTASTSKFFADGLTSCTSNNVLTWSGGTFGCEADDSGGSGSFAFTPGLFGATVVNATTTALQLQGGLFASSTVRFGNSGLPNFLWDSATGRLGIGTTSPYARLSVVGEVVATNFTATSTTATSTFAGGLNVGNGALMYDSTSLQTSIENLAIGALEFEADSGTLAWIDMPVTASASTGTIESYSAQIDGTPILTVYSESNGMGGIQNSRVGIGTTTPYSKLTVWSPGSIFEAVNNSSTTVFKIGQGGATSTSFAVTNLASCDTIDTDSSGNFKCGTDGGGGGGGDFPFTPGTYGATAVNATSSALKITGGIFASSTSEFVNAKLWGQLTFANQLLSSPLAVLGNGNSFIVASTTAYSTGLGEGVLTSITTGYGNTAFGFDAMRDMTSGYENTGFGASALRYATSTNSNTAIGFEALRCDGSNCSGSGNLAIGRRALFSNSSGYENIAIGNAAMHDNKEGLQNIAIGPGAMNYATSTQYNIAIGPEALRCGGGECSGTESNIAIGRQAMYTGGGEVNIAIGGQALFGNKTGLYNIALGQSAMQNATSTQYNVAIGIDALNCSGGANCSGNSNVAIGHQAGRAISTGSESVFLGMYSGYGMSTGGQNIGLGYGTLMKATSTSNNVAVGHLALHCDGGVNCSGANNVGLGYRAGFNISSGGNNTFLGYQAGYDVTSGQQNIILGAQPNNGNGITTGTNNIQIGYDLRVGFTNTLSNQLNIGNLIFGTSTASGTTISGGRLGIGSTTPMARFSIAGNNGDTNRLLFAISSSTASAVSSLFQVDNIGRTGLSTSTPWGLLSVGMAADLGTAPAFAVGSSTATVFLINNGGKVGMGTTTPWGLLSINPTATLAAGPAFVIGSSTRTLFRVDNVGNAYVGDTSSTGDAAVTYGLDANAWSMGYSSGDKSFRIASSTALGTSDALTALTISKNGNLKLGIASTTPWRTLSLVGSMAVNGLSAVAGTDQSVCIDGTTFEITTQAGDTCNTSAARYKHDINSLGFDALAMIRNFNPVSFVYNGDVSSTTHWGFIADEMASSSPQLAAFNADGSVQTINHLAITSVLTKAVKELDVRVNALTGGIESIGTFTTVTASTTNTGVLCLSGECRSTWTGGAPVDLTAYASKVFLGSATTTLTTQFGTALSSATSTWNSALGAATSSLATNFDSIVMNASTSLSSSFTSMLANAMAQGASTTAITIGSATSTLYSQILGELNAATSSLYGMFQSELLALSNDAATTTENDIPVLSATTSALALTDVPATTTATTTPWIGSFAMASQGLKNGILSLADTVVHVFTKAFYATTGIFEKVFAREVHTDMLCVADDSGETCLTKAQLDALLAGAAASLGGGEGAQAPEGEPEGGNASSTPPAEEPEAEEPPAEDPPAEEAPPTAGGPEGNPEG